MAFTGNEDHLITLDAGAEMTERYRRTIAVGEQLGAFFGKTDLLHLLGGDGCVGLRYYYGFDENNKKVLVLVGVDADGNDLVNGLIMERGYPCPNLCGNDNALNSDH